MSGIVLAMILTSLLRSVYGANNTEECPKGCRCDPPPFDTQLTSLTVDCGPSFPVSDVDQLTHQLDSMLSSDHMVERLTVLSITNTPLTHVPASVCQLLKLSTLHLDGNRLTTLPDNCLTKLSKLVTFTADNNAIVGLQDGLFDGLQSLEAIGLTHNHISFIGLRVFSNASDMTSLRLISLLYNQLTSLEPWWYYRCIHGSDSSPVTVDIRFNFVTNFTNEMQFHYRCGMKPPFGVILSYHNKIRHITDILNGWNIDYKEYLCLLNGLPRQRMYIDLSGEEYVCDCKDFWFYQWATYFPTINYIQNVRCGDDYYTSFDGALIPQYAVTYALTDFICDLTDRCPPGCRCVYRPGNSTLHVNCSSANLTSLPHDLPPLPKTYVRYKLDFSNNKLLRRLEYRPYFVNTSILDVRNCAISNVDANAWRGLAKMQAPFVTPSIYIQQNKMKFLPREVTNVSFASVILTLNENPWECSCANSWMTSWFRAISLTSSNGGDVLCASPSRLEGRSIAELGEDDFCVDPAIRILKISLSSTLSSVIVLLILGFVFYRLRVRLYRRWKFHPFDRDECAEEVMDYDVFLCCSSEDHRPHAIRILELTEANGYRVCYHERDFLPGSLITDNMSHSIQRSKRTVCLISNNFLKRRRLQHAKLLEDQESEARTHG